MKIRLILLATITMAAMLAAQSGARITGVTTDASGAVLPGVKVTAAVGNETRSITSDDRGRYELNALPAGACRVSASLGGFRTIERNVTLTEGDTYRTDFSMHVGCLDFVDYVYRGLRDVASNADLVAVVRTQGSPRQCTANDGCKCFEQSYLVEEVIGGPVTLTGAAITLEFHYRENLPVSGQQFVGFFQSLGKGRYTATTTSMLAVRGDEVQVGRHYLATPGDLDDLASIADLVLRIRRLRSAKP